MRVGHQDSPFSQATRALLRQHGWQPQGTRYVTFVPGRGGQMRNRPKMPMQDKGTMQQKGVVECQICVNSRLNRLMRLGPYRDWYEGHTAKEKHSHTDGRFPSKTMGLKLRCLYTAYMDHLREAQLAYECAGDPTRSELATSGRLGMVSVSVNDILSVESESLTTELRFHASQDDGIVLMVSRLKVLDLVDQLLLVPSKEFLDAVLDAPVEWHQWWHNIIDSMQPDSWRQFVNDTTAHMKLSGGLPERFM